MTSPDPTTIGMLLAAITGLGSAIGVLWRQVTKHFVFIEAKLKDCEDDRLELWKYIAKQSGQNVDDLRKTNTRNEK
tara:strand:+ start:381 stop:608 length:228 start_codon:yes stop_codon:yes gene_type:complete